MDLEQLRRGLKDKEYRLQTLQSLIPKLHEQIKTLEKERSRLMGWGDSGEIPNLKNQILRGETKLEDLKLAHPVLIDGYGEEAWVVVKVTPKLLYLKSPGSLEQDATRQVKRDRSDWFSQYLNIDIEATLDRVAQKTPHLHKPK